MMDHSSDQHDVGPGDIASKKDWVAPALTQLSVKQTRTGGIPIGEGFLPAITAPCNEPDDPFCFFPS